MKLKIIDLLNKIANGEKLPKIKINNKEFIWNDKFNVYKSSGTCLCFDYFIENNKLNNEVEIIEDNKEDNKKIEKIKYYDYLDKSKIIDKINEIIDKLNEGDE